MHFFKFLSNYFDDLQKGTIYTMTIKRKLEDFPMKMTNKEKTAQKTEIHDRLFRQEKHPDKNVSKWFHAEPYYLRTQKKAQEE